MVDAVCSGVVQALAEDRKNRRLEAAEAQSEKLATRLVQLKADREFNRAWAAEKAERVEADHRAMNDEPGSIRIVEDDARVAWQDKWYRQMARRFGWAVNPERND
jgi:predicted DCC family thiol-disulfide oxidoreductase YuxK